VTGKKEAGIPNTFFCAAIMTQILSHIEPDTNRDFSPQGISFDAHNSSVR
jgi:hypothetical protein